jgi:hypothetical protein
MTQANKPMTAEELSEIKARCEAATPGTWVVFELENPGNSQGEKQFGRAMPPETIRTVQTAWNHGQLHAPVEIVPLCLSPFYAHHTFIKIEKGDAEFIAYAREDVPRLVAEVERLHDELLSRDAIWLPAKDAEIERLSAERDAARMEAIAREQVADGLRAELAQAQRDIEIWGYILSIEGREKLRAMAADARRARQEA